MSLGVGMGLAGAFVVLSLVVAYWAATLLGLSALRPLLLRPRRILMLAGIALSLGGLLLDAGPATAAAAAASVAGAGYAWKRQWLLGHEASPATPRELALPPGEPVIVLEEGAALPLRWLARARVVTWEGRWVVHCALAGSVAVFVAPPGCRPRALLPLDVGFLLAARGRRWEGVFGAAHDGGAPLAPAPFALTSHAAWRAGYPGAPLLGPPPPASVPVPRRPRPRVPGARGLRAPLAEGVVQAGRWRPGAPGQRPAIQTVLSAWAARRLGLPAEPGL